MASHRILAATAPTTSVLLHAHRLNPYSTWLDVGAKRGTPGGISGKFWFRDDAMEWNCSP